MMKYIEIQKEVLNDYGIEKTMDIKNSLKSTYNLILDVGRIVTKNEDEAIIFVYEMFKKYDLILPLNL